MHEVERLRFACEGCRGRRRNILRIDASVTGKPEYFVARGPSCYVQTDPQDDSCQVLSQNRINENWGFVTGICLSRIFQLAGLMPAACTRIARPDRWAWEVVDRPRRVEGIDCEGAPSFSVSCS